MNKVFGVLVALVACGTDNPPDVCADALAHQEAKGCSLGDPGALDICHRRAPVVMCTAQFDAFIACLNSEIRSRPACNCGNEELLLRACAD